MSEKENPKMLLVDDKPENLKVLIRILEDFDVDLVTAANGNEALAQTLQQEFALILMDVQMPGMDGFETAELMRSRIDTPIIFITAYSPEQHNLARGYEAGAVDYLVKPINPYILKSKVQVFLALFEQKQALAAKNAELFLEIEQRRIAEEKLRLARESLADKVRQRTRELQAAYETLREGEERIRLVINSIPAMVAFLDRERRYLFANRQYEQYTGASHGLEGQSLENVLGEKAYRKLKPHLEAVFAGKTVCFEVEIPRQDDVPGILVATYIPYIVSGTVAGFFALIQDITDQRAAEEKQRLMEAQFRQLKKLKALATLTGGVAHEFNNLLVPIIGFSKMVRNGQTEGSSEADYLDRVIRAAYRARDIVSQVRLFSHKGEKKHDTMNLGPIIEEALSAVQQILPGNIHLKKEIRNDLHPVMGNISSLRQLVQNICENAVEAMPDGGELSVRLLCGQEAGFAGGDKKNHDCYCVRLEFEDNGHGMTPEIQDQIFDPFFTTKEQASHTGLGLSVALGIVEQMDGRIEVESAPDKGTRFSVILPAFNSHEQKAGLEDTAGGRLSGTSILIIDEEDVMLDVNRQYLQAAGYQITTDTDGIHAMAVFNQNPYGFDAIVVDQSMRLISGIEFAGKIRVTRPDIPIILCTGLIDEEMRNACRKHGIAQVIQKPFGVEEISRAVQKALLENSEV